MKLVCWTALIATLFAQNLERLSQVRTLVLLLLLSATAVGGFTAWQYLRGMGLKIALRRPWIAAHMMPAFVPTTCWSLSTIIRCTRRPTSSTPSRASS